MDNSLDVPKSGIRAFHVKILLEFILHFFKEKYSVIYFYSGHIENCIK